MVDDHPLPILYIYPFAIRYLSYCESILYLSILGFRLLKYVAVTANSVRFNLPARV